MYAEVITVRDEFKGIQLMKQITFEVCAQNLKFLPKYCELNIQEYSPNRNVDQNAKYWTLVSDIARMTDSSRAVVHNQLLNDYGELEMEDGEPVTIVLPEKYDYLEDKDLHLCPAGKMIRVGDEAYIVFYKLIDSKNMTKKQFSRLIDGALYERNSLEL